MSFRIFGRRPITFITPFVLFTSFILLLLVSISLPIMRPIYLLEISANLPEDAPKTSLATSVRFGLWGYCLGAYSFRNNEVAFKSDIMCSKPQVGYTIDPVISGVVGLEQSVTDIISKVLTAFLLIHPICCGLTFLTIFPTLLRIIRNTTPQFVQVTTLIIAIFPALLTTVVFAIDIVLVVVARQKVWQATNGELGVHWGNAVWMSGASVALLWIGVVGLSAVACGCCGCGWRETYEKRRQDEEQQVEEQKY